MRYMADSKDGTDDDDEINVGNESDEECPGGIFNDDQECGDWGTYWAVNRDNINNEAENNGSDFAESDDGLVTPSSSDKDDLKIRSNHEDLKFVVCIHFTTRDQVRNVVQQWALLNGHNMGWGRSASDRVEAICSGDCSWWLYASRIGGEKTFRIRSVEDYHTCPRAMINRQATAEWVAKDFIQKFRRNPMYAPKDIMLDIKEKYNGLIVSRLTCYKARDIAMEITRGSLESHYATFRSYDTELKRVDREGLFRFYFIHNPDNGAPIFQRYYVGFSGLKKVVGALLSAVARDGNNHMYPFVWAIVEAENKETWTWFIQLLMDDLGYDDGFGLSLHKNCARHIYANWKKNHKGPELKRIFWNVVNATNEFEYEAHLKMLEKESPLGHTNLIKQRPTVFCKAFVRMRPLCDVITSNLVETFNGYICKARQLQVVHMLEEIRTTLMERIYTKNELMLKHHEDLCPGIRQKKRIEGTRFCNVTPAVDSFQVKCFDFQFFVHLTDRTCSCRAWQLTGIPCCHAISCITFMRHNVMNYVDNCYKRAQYLKAYEFSLQPINGPNMWPYAQGFPIIPPPYRKMSGRPKKN
ncbi:uncharacterized protein LOC126687596 [Mercurialis annua]|uniref:uncharacterized protein LOC126687596 n=1 Tax=Mercurialis annua TaxID=3986 RepID=UPI00215F24DC|nr:uncharacterized protein LOC126687596 [Mercurialis annua]